MTATLKPFKRAAQLATIIALVLTVAACSSNHPPATIEETPQLCSPLAALPLLTEAKSRSISPENFTGEKGAGGMATEGTGKNAARELGQTWKLSPSVRIKAHSTLTLADIAGPGCITHIWMTPSGNWRHEIIRAYWDNDATPSIESPAGDFFACGLRKYAQVSSPVICVNPGSGFNSYWPMPFRKAAKITFENLDDKDMILYFQVDYELTTVPAHAAYLHAQFRIESPLKIKGIYTLLDGVKGKGQYVGTYMTCQTRGTGWWGEGEMKFFIDGDAAFPTICTTGTEDYFGGSYDFEDRAARRYVPFSTPYTGLVQVIPPDQVYVANQKFGLYRWHLADPIRFTKDLKVEIQDLGWQSDGRYAQLQDSISTVSYWYQSLPHAAFPPFPSREELDR